MKIQNMIDLFNDFIEGPIVKISEHKNYRVVVDTGESVLYDTTEAEWDDELEIFIVKIYFPKKEIYPAGKVIQ